MLKLFRENVSLLFRGYKEVYSLNHTLIFTSIFQGIFSSLLPIINLVVTSIIINTLLSNPTKDNILPIIVISLGINLTSYLLSNGLEHFRKYQIVQTKAAKNMKINDKILSMDYQYIEDTKTIEMRQEIELSDLTYGYGLNYLMNETKQIIYLITTVILSFLMSLPLFTSRVVETSKYAVLNNNFIYVGIIMYLVLYSFISNFLNKKGESLFNKLQKGMLTVNNIYTYVVKQVLDYNSGKEIRLYKQQNLYKKILDDNYNGIKKAMFTKARMSCITSVVLEILINIFLGAIFLIAALKVIGKAIEPGSIVQYTGCVAIFIQAFPQFLKQATKLSYNNEYIKLYFEFLNIKDNNMNELNDKKLPLTDAEGIELEIRNLSFKYPNSENYVLKNINLKIENGKKLAIVGANGSGKTTLIKLICRLYEPSEGEILLNNINIQEYGFSEYIRLISVVFQDYSLFSFSLGQNISACTEYDSEKSIKAIKEIGFYDRYEKFEKGLETALYKRFDNDGVEISGGEAQKIAMARAIYKDSPIMILDEPTASLDPISEFEIYKNFSEISKGKTTLFISHRLSSCRFCDEIIVLDKGSIVQQDTHDNLLKNEEGKYYNLWNAQAKYYI